MKRREFIKASGLLSMGLATAPMWFRMPRLYSQVVGSASDLRAFFGVGAEEAQKLLTAALERGADWADLFFEYRINTGLRMEDDIIKDVSHGIVVGMGVRAVRGEQIGYAYTDDVTFDAMLNAARAAAVIANDKKQVPPVAIKSVKIKNLYSVGLPSVDAAVSDKINLLERANQAAHQTDSRITKINIGLSDELKRIMYYDSTGKFFTDTQPMVSLYIAVVAEEGTRRQRAGANRAARAGLEIFKTEPYVPETVAREAAQIALTNLDARPAPAGPQVVVLGPAESGVLLHEAVGHGLEADANRKKLSNYSDLVGQKVAAEQCTIVDSGLFPAMRGSINIDDEGSLPTETVLIENGVLRGYLHDRISATCMKAQPTGNGRRQSYAHPPIPRMTNTFLRPGKYDPREIIESVKFGVFAKRFSGGQVDTTKGDFTFGVIEAYLIEDGKITAPLKDVTLIGNGPEVMRNLVLTGNDLQMTRGTWTCGKDGQSVPVGQGIPTVKVTNITVGGTQT